MTRVELVAIAPFQAWDAHGHVMGPVSPGTRLINCAPAIAEQLMRAGVAVPVDDIATGD